MRTARPPLARAFCTSRARPSLLVWARHQRGRANLTPFGFEELAGQCDVLAGVGGCGLDEDGVGRYAVFYRVLAVVDGFASRKPVNGGGRVCAGETISGKIPRT
jgi:hypothetical protein